MRTVQAQIPSFTLAETKINIRHLQIFQNVYKFLILRRNAFRADRFAYVLVCMYNVHQSHGDEKNQINLKMM